MLYVEWAKLLAYQYHARPNARLAEGLYLSLAYLPAVMGVLVLVQAIRTKRWGMLWFPVLMALYFTISFTDDVEAALWIALVTWPAWLLFAFFGGLALLLRKTAPGTAD